MAIRKYSYVSALAMATVLTACGGGSSGGGSAAPASVAGDFGNIVGFWNATEIDEGLEDVYYLEIFADGRLINWDYQGDAYDNGENCYDRSVFNLTSLGANQYTVFGITLTMTVNNNVLTSVESGPDGTSTMPAVVNFTSAEFNECE